MIVHIFTAERYHLVPGISRGFVTVYRDDADHFFILYGSKQLDKQRYINIYSQVDFKNYVFCQSFWQLSKLLFDHRRNTVLFHAGSYFWHLTAILLGCKNVNWVCWGGGTAISNTAKSQLGAKLKKFTFRRFHTIVTLMEPERREIIRNFGITPQKTQTISYVSTKDDETRLDLMCKKLSYDGSVNPDKPVVLLGNSHYWMDSYITMIDRLKQYKGKIKVQCMLNYDFEKNEKYQELVNLGRAVFGDDFKTNEEFYTLREDYINYINGCDIYICAVTKQTGLGAISTCLKLGKKIYITGNNLEWVRKEYDSIVFSLDMLNENLDFSEFARPLTAEERNHNYQTRVGDRAVHRDRWHEYLKKIDKD